MPPTCSLTLLQRSGLHCVGVCLCHVGSHQQHLTNAIEADQRRATRRIYHDSATELVNKPQLQTLREGHLYVQNNEWPCGHHTN